MTNNYIKVTTRTTRPASDLAHLGAEAMARSYLDRSVTSTSRPLNNLSWFIPLNDRDSTQFDAAKARADQVAAQCVEAFGVKHRGCFMSVFRDFPGNTLPVIGDGE